MDQVISYENYILGLAEEILLKRLQKSGSVIETIGELRLYLKLHYAALETEHFGCIFLDANYGVINHKKMFVGTISHCEVYPREVTRAALLANATFVILVHNHPAHNPGPSKNDIRMTQVVKKTLAALDIALFDHIIVAGPQIYSMMEEDQLT